MHFQVDPYPQAKYPGHDNMTKIWKIIFLPKHTIRILLNMTFKMKQVSIREYQSFKSYASETNQIAKYDRFQLFYFKLLNHWLSSHQTHTISSSNFWTIDFHLTKLTQSLLPSMSDINKWEKMKNSQWFKRNGWKTPGHDNMTKIWKIIFYQNIPFVYS